MSKWDENNTRVIAEFRANGGVVGGHYEGWPMLILHTIGAKSGTEHLSPLVYLPDDERMVIIASAGAQPKHPDWYHNLVAHPDVTVEVGSGRTRSPLPPAKRTARSATSSTPGRPRSSRSSRSTRTKPPARSR